MAELKEIQALIVKTRAERGFTTEPLKIFMLLNEEIGEIATELKKTWSSNYEAFSKQRLKDELADTLVLLLALASRYEIDLEEAVKAKFIAKDSQREWESAKAR